MLEKEAVDKGIDIEALKEEQKKLAKELILKDEFDFDNATRFAGIEVLADIDNKRITATIVVLDENLEVLEERYAEDRIAFPYIPGFRAYRELPVMLKALDKVEETPDVIFILGQGIAHPRGLGIASHFGLASSKPTIGIAKSMLITESEENKDSEDKLFMDGKIVAQKLITHEKGRPIIISPGNFISLATAVKITKRCLKENHKLPEPLVKAKKYLDRIRKELKSDNQTSL